MYTERQFQLYYSEDYRAKANAWWSSLSINQMKEFERKIGVDRFGRNASQTEICEIYDLYGPAKED